MELPELIVDFTEDLSPTVRVYFREDPEADDPLEWWEVKEALGQDDISVDTGRLMSGTSKIEIRADDLEPVTERLREYGQWVFLIGDNTTELHSAET